MAITDFSCVDEQGFPVLCDAYGTDVAFRCVGCGSPVLATQFPYQTGGHGFSPDPSRAARCRACGCAYWVETDAPKGRLILHRHVI